MEGRKYMFFWCSTWTVCASVGYTRCPGRTSEYLCASSLQNLAVPLDCCSFLSVLLERFCWPRIRWCGTGEFQDQGQCFFIGLGCSIPTIVFYYSSLSLLSVYMLVLWGWGLRTDRVYTNLSALHCRPLLIIIIIIIIDNKIYSCMILYKFLSDFNLQFFDPDY